MKRMIKTILASVFIVSAAYAGDLEWSGVYRIEANSFRNTELGKKKHEKSYGLQHLVLKPKIVAADGLTIFSRFDLFNSETYTNSQMGQTFGSGLGDGTPTSKNDSSTLSDSESPETIQITNLYITYVHEFGVLVAGRAPLNYGLGLSYSAGDGLFDHWYDNLDMVGYKFIMGNLYLMPIIGKSAENKIADSDDVDDLIIQAVYDNPETDLSMGVMYHNRKSKASTFSNDTPTGADGIGGAGATLDRGYDATLISLYSLKDTERYRLGVEAGLSSGKTGYKTAGGESININAFAIAGEFEYRPENSKFKFGVKAGTASGDDIETKDKYEGFIVDRNYDIAMLMFNHSLGQANFLRTEVLGTGPTDRGGDDLVQEQADTDAISNVMYFSPTLKYQWSDKWSIDSALTTGWLRQDHINGVVVDKSLGYELDFALNFKPTDKIMWVNQVGLLFPGTAYEADGNFDSSFAYGLVTKAAISF